MVQFSFSQKTPRLLFWGFFIYFVIIMANYKLIIGHTLKFEGGASADPNDNALKLGHSGVLGKDGGDRRFPNNYIHTNKGVIWATYVAYCNKVRKTPTSKEFISMPQSLWEDIMKKLFWDAIHGDDIKSQSIAEFIFEAVWGSGLGGIKSMVIGLQKFLRENGYDIAVDGTIGNNTIAALNKYVTSKEREKKVIDLLYALRKSFYKSLGSGYYNAWISRLDTLLSRSYSLIEENKYIVGGAGLLLIAASIALYTISKSKVQLI